MGKAWAALTDPQRRVVFQIAPAVRVAVGEAFGLKSGENALHKLVSALKIMGADAVYDTNVGADLTVMEETAEFLERVEKGGPFPMFTSCCPAWIKYLENEKPQYLKNISSCKSPMEMFAALLRKEYRAEGLYAADRDATMKFSQSNPVVKALYETGLKEDAHALLHVHYPSAE